MGFKIFSHASTPKQPLQVASRAKLTRNVVDSDQAVQFPAFGQVKATGEIRILSLGDAGEIQLPSWLPFIGTRCLRVQGEGTELDCLGRPVNVYQVDSAIVPQDSLRDTQVEKVDPLGKSTKVGPCKFRIGDRLEPNPKYFAMNRFTIDFVDLPRFFADSFGQDDYSYKAACPDELTPPFRILDIQYGKNKDFIPNCPDKIQNKKNWFYLIEGPIVDSYSKEGEPETVQYPVWFPKDLIEERFVLWQQGIKRQAA